MSVHQIKDLGEEIEMTIRVKVDKTSMLRSEELLEAALNEAGVAASEIVLENFDTDGSPIEVEGKILTSKGKQKKSIKDNMEE
jgi:hypothetical protein